MIFALRVRQFWLVFIVSKHRNRPYRMQTASKKADSRLVRAISLQIANQPLPESVRTFHAPLGALAKRDEAVSVQLQVYFLGNRGACYACAGPASIIQHAIAYILVLAFQLTDMSSDLLCRLIRADIRLAAQP